MRIQEDHPQLNQKLRLILIDDNPEWCKVIRRMLTYLGHTVEEANTIEEAQRKIREAENRNEPFAIAIVDMNFKSGEEEVQEGTDLIDYINEHYPYMACVIASGEKVLPDYVLDLRDEHQLDYYLQKDRISREKIKKALLRSYERKGDLWAQYIPTIMAGTPAEKRSGAASSPMTRQPEHIATSVSSVQAPRSATTPGVMQVQLDFQIDDDGTRITWRTPLIGRETTIFTAPYSSTELALVIQALDILQHPNYPYPHTEAERRRFGFEAVQQARLERLGLWLEDRVVSNAHQIVGQALYKGLGAKGQSVLKAINNASTDQNVTANYVFRFPPEAINLAALPWELLWDGEKNHAILIRGNKIDSCERYVDMDMAIPPSLPGGQKLHLLALTPRYGIPEELRQLEREARRKIWDKLRAEGKLTYDEIEPLTMADLNDYMDQLPQPPDIVHYFGHGTYRNGEGFLFFDNARGGRDLVSAKRLAAALGDVRLIVLHACQSATIEDEGGLLTGVAPALSIVAGAVVAMQLTVSTEAALRFAQKFYDQLLNRGRSLQQAVAHGRQVLFTEMSDGASWYVPTLYIRSREAQPIYFVS